MYLLCMIRIEIIYNIQSTTCNRIYVQSGSINCNIRELLRFKIQFRQISSNVVKHQGLFMVFKNAEWLFKSAAASLYHFSVTLLQFSMRNFSKNYPCTYYMLVQMSVATFGLGLSSK